MTVYLKWFPNSWFQIKSDDKVLYIDPAYLKPMFKDYPKKGTDDLPEDLKKADIIMVTHEHQDHCSPSTVNALKRSNTLVIAPKACADELDEDAKIIKPGEELDHDNVKIKAVEAYNTEYGHSTMKFHKKGESLGYLITLNGKTIYHAGDTDFIPEMKELGDVDVALVPIGGTYTMDMDEAVDAVTAIKPKIVIPMHMKDADPEEFKKIVEEKSDIKVVPLKIGGTYQLN
jgi:Predicted Zn-dependent hydrolases of the beta-lactamase fold